MKLRGIDFGHVIASSGSRNFFGEGYSFHRLWRPFGLRYDGSTFVAKTTTLHERAGNMPLKKDGVSPRELLPKCIKVYWFKGLVLNAVGLSGRGAQWLFEQGIWQKMQKPFFISFMSVENSAKKRADEMKGFVELFAKHLPAFRAKVGLEINDSCPNVGLRPAELIEEVGKGLDIAAQLNIPLVPNFSPTVPVKQVVEVAQHQACDAISIANTIPWGQLPERIDWKKHFGTNVSPLEEFGGGGLSGWPLLEIVRDWVFQARTVFSFRKPIIAGGGVLSTQDVNILEESGATAIKLGTISILRPLRVQKVIRHANWVFDHAHDNLFATGFVQGE